MADKNIRSVLLICLVVLSVAVFFSFISDGGQKTDSGSELEAMLCDIEGVEDVKVVYYYTDGGDAARPAGVVISYNGTGDRATDRTIYEMIHALYDIPYSRIYVSH